MANYRPLTLRSGADYQLEDTDTLIVGSGITTNTGNLTISPTANSSNIIQQASTGAAASGSTPATAAGTLSAIAGTGGAASVTSGGTASAGGVISITGGTGGLGAATTNTAGAGGAITIKGGNAGSDGGAGGANGGNVTIDGGTATSAGTPGIINIGTTNSHTINIGNSNSTTAFLGTVTGVGSGGMTNPMTTLGDIIYENSTPAPARLAGNTTSTKEFLTQTGTGSVSAAPVWGTIAATDLPALNGLAEADWSLTDDIVKTSSGGTNQYETVARLAGFICPDTMMARLSYSSSLPVTTSDMTAQSTLYLTPLYTGNRYTTYDGTRWREYSLTSALTLPLQQTISVSTNSTTTITLLSGTTAQLVRGMTINISAIPFLGTIATIPSSTTFTVASSSGLGTHASESAVCAVPTSTCYDVYLIDNSGTPALQFGNAWTTSSGSSAARADTIGAVDGVYMNTAAINSADNNTIGANKGRYLGTIYTSNIGTGEDSGQNRWCFNLYNPVQRHLISTDGGNTIRTNSTTTYAQVGSVQVSYVIGFSTQSLRWQGSCAAYNSNTTGLYVIVAIGSSVTAKLTGSVTSFNVYATGGQAAGTPYGSEYAPIGQQTRYLVFKSSIGGDAVSIDSSDGDQPSTALFGSIMA